MGRQERLRTPGQNKTEKLFSAVALEVGAQIHLSPVIESPFPVADKCGIVKKTKTNPDFYLVFPDGRSMYVEVAKGAGDAFHKEAQLRVVRGRSGEAAPSLFTLWLAATDAGSPACGLLDAPMRLFNGL